MKIVTIAAATLIASVTTGAADPSISESAFTTIMRVDHAADTSQLLAQQGHNSLIIVNPCPDVGECPEPFGEPRPPEADSLIRSQDIFNMIHSEGF